MLRILLPLLLSGLALTAQNPNRVLVIYNSQWPDGNGDGVGDSLEVAQDYAARRGVPSQNLLGVQCSTGLQHYYYDLPGWVSFWDEMVVPVRNKLNALGQTNIDTLLFCYGVPYELALPVPNGGTRALDDFLKSPFTLGTRAFPLVPQFRTNPYHEASPTRPPDKGAFDHALYRFGLDNMYLAARLDGENAAAAKSLVEGALYGERYLSPSPGYHQGNCYVDTRYSPYTDTELQAYPFGYQTYAMADKSMAFGKFFVAASGYPWKWERSGVEIGDANAVFHDNSPAQSAPAALFYGGWYNYAKYNDVWTWITGSAAIDLNSNSLSGIRNPATVSFLTKSFARGLTCGTGCITEPYLNGHPQPETFLYYMLNGLTFAEAAMLCNPVMGWVNLAVGDPMYAPTRPGRVPVIDTTPPPAPAIRVVNTSATDRAFHLALPTLGREPDVASSELRYGTTTAYGSVQLGRRGYHREQVIALSGLPADTLFHGQVLCTDPAGHTSQSPDFVFYTKGYEPALAGINPPQSTATVPQPVTLDFTLGHPNGLAGLAAVAILISAPHLNVIDADITSIVLGLTTSYAFSPGYDLLNLQVAFPSRLPPGTYTLKLRVTAHGSNANEDLATLVVP